MLSYRLSKLEKICEKLGNDHPNKIVYINDISTKHILIVACPPTICFICRKPIYSPICLTTSPILRIIVSYPVATLPVAHFHCVFKALQLRKSTRTYPLEVIEYMTWDILRGMLQWIDPILCKDTVWFYVVELFYNVLKQLHLFISKPSHLSVHHLRRLQYVLHVQSKGFNLLAITEIKTVITAVDGYRPEVGGELVMERDDICHCFYTTIQQIFCECADISHGIRMVLYEVLPRYIAFIKRHGTFAVYQQIAYICLNTAPLVSNKAYSSSDILRILELVVEHNAFEMLCELSLTRSSITFAQMLEIISTMLIPLNISQECTRLLFGYFKNSNLFCSQNIHKIIGACITRVLNPAEPTVTKPHLWEGVGTIYDIMEPRDLKSVDMLHIIRIHYMCDTMAGIIFTKFFTKFYKRLNYDEFTTMMNTMDSKLTHATICFMCSVVTNHTADMLRVRCILCTHYFLNKDQVGEVLRIAISNGVIDKDGFLKLLDYVSKNGMYPDTISMIFELLPVNFYITLVSSKLDLMIELCERMDAMGHVVRILPYITDVSLIKNISKRSLVRIFSFISILIRNGKEIPALNIINCDAPIYYVHFYTMVKVIYNTGISDMNFKMLIAKMLTSPKFDQLVERWQIKKVIGILMKFNYCSEFICELNVKIANARNNEIGNLNDISKIN